MQNDDGNVQVYDENEDDNEAKLSAITLVNFHALRTYDENELLPYDAFDLKFAFDFYQNPTGTNLNNYR